jgi:N-acetylneuraminic acid mutarotase
MLLRSLKVRLYYVFICFAAMPCLSKSLPDLPDLPEPVSNNAVAKVSTGSADYLISFMGLAKAKEYSSVHNRVWVLKVGDDTWQSKKSVPSSLTLKGRLASIAVGVGSNAYVFGGYTVAQDHAEISSPDNFRYNPVTDIYTKIAKTPIPVDDAVALVYQQRYIYLISGWHNDGNVNLVQVYDVDTDSWFQASPFLGQAVFGHAGAILDNKMVVCDGVVVKAQQNKRRTFTSEPACYLGVIDIHTANKIDWRLLQHPNGKARYRMAATGSALHQKLLFWGGSDNPYNYNGMGYNGKPSSPSSQLWLYDIESNTWKVENRKIASMDHRGLLELNDEFIVVGGMSYSQEVSAEVIAIKLAELSPDSFKK